MSVNATLKKLCSLPGVSGREDEVRAHILRVLAASPAEMEVSVDRLGSVVARGHGAKDLMPGGTHAAHEDGPEIGSGTGLIAQDEYFHGISFAHLSGGYAP